MHDQNEKLSFRGIKAGYETMLERLNLEGIDPINSIFPKIGLANGPRFSLHASPFKDANKLNIRKATEFASILNRAIEKFNELSIEDFNDKEDRLAAYKFIAEIAAWGNIINDENNWAKEDSKKHDRPKVKAFTNTNLVAYLYFSKLSHDLDNAAEKFHAKIGEYGEKLGKYHLEEEKTSEYAKEYQLKKDTMAENYKLIAGDEGESNVSSSEDESDASLKNIVHPESGGLKKEVDATLKTLENNPKADNSKRIQTTQTNCDKGISKLKTIDRELGLQTIVDGLRSIVSGIIGISLKFSGAKLTHDHKNELEKDAKAGACLGLGLGRSG